MKVPFSSPKNHQSSNVKPFNNTVRSSAPQGSTNTTNLCYEPKSVLDLRRSPSPVPEKPATNTEISAFSDVLLQFDEDPSLQWVDHIVNNSDWDSLMRELGLHDDSAPALKSNIPQFTHCEPPHQFPAALPEFPPSHSFDHTRFVPSDFTLSGSDINLNHNFGLICNDFHHWNWNVGLDFVDELIGAAECFESNELQLAHVILARLNQQLRSPVGKPLQRAAFYFKEALQSLLSESNRPTRHPSSSLQVVQTIEAYKAFSNVSPIVMFSNFTANQAILEAMDGSMLFHVIDFDIGLGGHWASFMKEIADKAADSRKANIPSVLRITAVVPEEYGVESRLIRENLSQFACELKIGFDIEFVLIRTFEFLSFKAIKFIDGEKTAVLLSPAIFRRIGTGILTDLRRISPHVVVYVDSEGVVEGGASSSFRRSVIDGLEFYSAVMESLDAAIVGSSEDWIQRIEMFVLRPKIISMVEEAAGQGQHSPPWRAAFAGAGMRPVSLSQFADFQADCLLRRIQVRGFHVAKRQAEMVLCWHERALASTSAWRC
uniref:Putative scarecrow-like protein 15 n=1 Tax=Davidia involucrata TaxID=16924 RepID=A0A5B7BQ61_DAVIN